jgi:hypothetical protein
MLHSAQSALEPRHILPRHVLPGVPGTAGAKSSFFREHGRELSTGRLNERRLQGVVGLQGVVERFGEDPLVGVTEALGIIAMESSPDLPASIQASACTF